MPKKDPRPRSRVFLFRPIAAGHPRAAASSDHGSFSFGGTPDAAPKAQTAEPGCAAASRDQLQHRSAARPPAAMPAGRSAAGSRDRHRTRSSGSDRAVERVTPCDPEAAQDPLESAALRASQAPWITRRWSPTVPPARPRRSKLPHGSISPIVHDTPESPTRAPVFAHGVNEKAQTSLPPPPIRTTDKTVIGCDQDVDHAPLRTRPNGSTTNQRPLAIPKHDRHHIAAPPENARRPNETAANETAAANGSTRNPAGRRRSATRRGRKPRRGPVLHMIAGASGEAGFGRCAIVGGVRRNYKVA
jgi:hypothetical protein